jgi:hypothetical protein
MADPFHIFFELLVRRDPHRPETPKSEHGDCVYAWGWMALVILCPSDDTRITKSYFELALN